MKNKKNYVIDKKAENLETLSIDDYTEMFEDGYSDTEIAKEYGIDRKYIKNLREEYQKDF